MKSIHRARGPFSYKKTLANLPAIAITSWQELVSTQKVVFVYYRPDIPSVKHVSGESSALDSMSGYYL